MGYVSACGPLGDGEDRCVEGGRVPCRTSAVSCFSCYADGSHLNVRVASGFEFHLIGSEVGLAFGVLRQCFGEERAAMVLIPGMSSS